MQHLYLDFLSMFHLMFHEQNFQLAHWCVDGGLISLGDIKIDRVISEIVLKDINIILELLRHLNMQLQLNK